MIDFKNAKFAKLRLVDNDAYSKLIDPMLINGENVVFSFKGIRDGVVFTNKRIISINIQGMTGSKKDITTLPYKKVQAFSVETAGVFDMECELELWFSSLGCVRFEFLRNANVEKICQLISVGSL